MCGIAGIFDLRTDKSAKIRTLQRMISAIQHRGPDAWGTYASDEMALGHCRLSIIDLAGGNQPMTTDRYVISYNGEVYNHIELRHDLEKAGISFDTTSDTEVVLKAVEVYGTKAFSMFNGQFALLLWDRKEKQLIAARDRYGVRPLYILSHQGGLYFSSEMKAFDAIGGYERQFDFENLLEHALLWNTLGDGTVFKNIRSLPAGTFEIYKSPEHVSNGRYYEIGESLDTSGPRTFAAAKEELKDLLDDSVKLRLRSDVPVAVYLSGGIDSSVITHITRQNYAGRMKTFSVSFKDREFDESGYQDEMAAFADTEHDRITCEDKNINDNFLESVRHFERPVFRTAGVPLYLLSREVNSKGIKVVLTGEGADEILYGYDSFKELKLLSFWRKNPRSKLRPMLIKRLYPHLKHYSSPQQFGLLRIYYEGFLNNYEKELSGLNIRVHNNKIMQNYFNKDVRPSFDKEVLLEKIRKILPSHFHNWSLLQQNQFLEMKTLLSGYLLSSQGDRMSMAHSVEGRYPFLDHRVVERLFYYPDAFKLNGFKQKFLLSEAYKDKIPLSIINRPKKPYTAPDLKAFYCNGRLSEQASFFLSEDKLKSDGLFDEKRVKKLLNKFDAGMPSETGYRDNMLITFILSCQMVKYWSRRPVLCRLDERLKTVDVLE